MTIRLRGEHVAKQGLQLYERANRRSAGWLAVFARALLSLNRNRTTESAAAISFYSIFSIIPLLVFTIIALRPFAELPAIENALREYLASSFPLSLERLMDEVNVVIEARGSLGLIAVFGFLWAASEAFNAMILSINRAWGVNTIRSRVQSRLVALATVTVLAAVFVLLLTLLRLVSLAADLLVTSWASAGFVIVPILVHLLLAFILLRLGPATRVNGKAAFVAALAVTLAAQLVTWGFTWYLNSAWSTYHLLYGSFGTIVGTLFWVYLSNLIWLFGAYLTEAIQARWNSADPTHRSMPLELPAFE